MTGIWVFAGLLVVAGAAGQAAVAEDNIGAGPVTIPLAPIEQSITSVARVVHLEKAENPTRLISSVGGDPAINGEYLFMVVDPESMADPQATFQIGDFNSWEIAEEARDHVMLTISRSWVDDASGEIKTAEEKWTVPMVGADARELKITIAK